MATEFNVNLHLDSIPPDSAMARVLKGDETNHGSFLMDLDRLKTIFIGDYHKNRSLLSLRGQLGEAKKKLNELENSLNDKNELDKLASGDLEALQSERSKQEELVARLSLEKQEAEQQILKDFAQLWVNAFSAEKTFHFMVQMQRTTREGIIKRIQASNPGANIPIPDMGMINTLEASLQYLKDLKAEHLAQSKRGEFVGSITNDIQDIDLTIRDCKERLQKEFEKIEAEMKKAYGEYNPNIQQQFLLALAESVLPQAFSSLPTAAFSDILMPHLQGTHFAANESCCQTAYFFNLSSNKDAINVKVHMDVYATQYRPFPANPLAEQPSIICPSAQQITTISGEKREPQLGDYRLFKQGKEVWVDSEQFAEIQKNNFAGYDRILTLQTEHQVNSLSYATPLSIIVVPHVNIPLDARFLLPRKPDEMQETSLDQALLAREDSSPSIGSAYFTGDGALFPRAITPSQQQRPGSPPDSPDSGYASPAPGDGDEPASGSPKP